MIKVTSVRWIILALLAALSVVSYVLRVNISIAAKPMMLDLGLSEIQMGLVFSSFMLGYALFQVPGGVLGDRLGPRIVLSVVAALWGLATLLTALVPGAFVSTSAGVMLSLILFRFLLGAAEAATYPVAVRAVANWIPCSSRALGTAVVLAGMPLGSAVTPPLVSWLMVNLGWRESFYLTSGLAFLVAVIWWLYARDLPEAHRRVSPGELALIRAGQPEAANPSAAKLSWWRLLKDRNICLLTLSYFFEGYVLFMFVFWLYIYLVDVRGFTLLSGGLFASLPWLAALVLTPLGGAVADSLSVRFGRLAGSRLVVVTVYLLSCICLFLGARTGNRYLAVAVLSLSVGFLMAAEPGFWSSATHIAGGQAGAAGGILNTGGILGGVVSTAVVPILVKHFGWMTALNVGCVIALACALVWLAIREARARSTVSALGTPA